MTIFIHGLGQTPASWDETLACLPETEALCPSLPGLLTGGPVDYPNLSAAFSAYCDERPQPLRLCGLSLGSVLALDYALRRPEKVESLALVAPQVKMPVGLLRVQNAVFRLMPQKAFMETGFGKRDFLSLCRSMTPLDFRPALHKLTCPVLVLCGAGDRANRKSAEELSRSLPLGKLAVVPQAGHEVNTDQPAALAELLADFWSKGKGS